MKWFLVMVVCIAECSVDEIGIRKTRVEMHLSKVACDWAKDEAMLARGYVIKADCEARSRHIVPKFYWPQPRQNTPTARLAEVRP